MDTPGIIRNRKFVWVGGGGCLVLNLHPIKRVNKRPNNHGESFKNISLFAFILTYFLQSSTQKMQLYNNFNNIRINQ